MSAAGSSLPLGRVSGFRGAAGEVTVRVASGDAARWTGLTRVGLRVPGSPEGAVDQKDVETCRAYRDRLVLKLRGIDDANTASRLTGALVEARPEDVPALPHGVYWVERLIGSLVVEDGGRELGRVADVLATGGTDLLVVRADGGRETMVPLAREIVTDIDEASGILHVKLPFGLRELNQPQGDPGGGAA